MDAGGPGAYVAAATAVMASGTIAGRMAAVMKEFSPAGNMVRHAVQNMLKSLGRQGPKSLKVLGLKLLRSCSHSPAVILICGLCCRCCSNTGLAVSGAHEPAGAAAA